jgi:hypothetical protein
MALTVVGVAIVVRDRSAASAATASGSTTRA